MYLLFALVAFAVFGASAVYLLLVGLLSLLWLSVTFWFRSYTFLNFFSALLALKRSLSYSSCGSYLGFSKFCSFFFSIQ